MFCAEHSESIDEVIRWPESKFRAMYGAFVKRKIGEEIDARRIGAISALHGNSTYSESGTQGGEAFAQRIRAIEESADEAIARLYSSTRTVEVEDEDPFGFFAAGREGMRRNGLID